MDFLKRLKEKHNKKDDLKDERSPLEKIFGPRKQFDMIHNLSKSQALDLRKTSQLTFTNNASPLQKIAHHNLS